MCIAVAATVIRSRARRRFFNLVDLVDQLEQEKAAGRSGQLAETLMRYDVIVIDELGYLPFSQLRWTPLSGQETGRLKRESRRFQRPSRSGGVIQP